MNMTITHLQDMFGQLSLTFDQSIMELSHVTYHGDSNLIQSHNRECDKLPLLTLGIDQYYKLGPLLFWLNSYKPADS